MLAEERFSAILAILAQKSAATVAELSESIGTSESTIRRDLIVLAGQGKLNKVHGGATSVENEFVAVERDIPTKESLYMAEKEKIARYAAAQIQADDFVFIDAGTTTLRLAECITATKTTFVTNGIAHARILGQKGLKVYVLGGQIKPSTEAIVGIGAVNSLRQYNFTKAFMGVDGVSIKQGFSTPDTEEALLKAEAMRHSYISYMLADSSKFNKVYAAQIAELSGACIITDRLVDEKYKQHAIIKEVDAG